MNDITFIFLLLYLNGCILNRIIRTRWASPPLLHTPMIQNRARRRPPFSAPWRSGSHRGSGPSRAGIKWICLEDRGYGNCRSFSLSTPQVAGIRLHVGASKSSTHNRRIITLSCPNVDRVRVVHSDYENTAFLDRDVTSQAESWLFYRKLTNNISENNRK